LRLRTAMPRTIIRISRCKASRHAQSVSQIIGKSDRATCWVRSEGVNRSQFVLQQGASQPHHGVSVIYVLDPARRSVETRSHCELEGLCFLATITSIHTGKRDRAAILRCAYELQSYLNFAKGVVIEGVQMLCPPDLTGRRSWSLETLVQIVCFRGVDTEDSAVVYETSVGTYKLGELDLRRKKTRHVWYSERHLRAHSPRASNHTHTVDTSEPQFYGSMLTDRA
jgi:hypothetical protein